RVPRAALRAGAGLLLLTLVVLSNRDSRHYRIPELWASTLAKNPGCWLCEINLGVYSLFDLGRVSESIQHTERALALKPESTEAMVNLGLGELFQGRLEEAIRCFDTVLARPPDSARNESNAHAGLGNALVLRGEVERGIAQLEQAVRLAPRSTYARFSLGSALEHQGRMEDAVVQYEQAVSLRPTWIPAREALMRAQIRAEHRQAK
ncbi:MAG TPA: tetratricopeptide repeat protein, partial [Myxococcota bacterium]|nr:tetratricopeptide repeat protein [Myxococcota bacterium]